LLLFGGERDAHSSAGPPKKEIDMRYLLRTLLIVVATLSTLPAVAQEKADPTEALYGEWEIVEMIFHATVQDFGSRPGGWFIFDKDGVICIPSVITDAKTLESFKRTKGTKNGLRHAITVRPGELDTHYWFSPTSNYTLLAKYELADGKLRIIEGSTPNERPTDFDEAIKDRRLTYYGLKKVK
jgi:hypothetical protein